jgi:Zn-dependent protease/CBS domain-containing protein
MARQRTESSPDPRSRRSSRLGGIRLGSIAGIEIFADWSLIIIFLLVAMSLGLGALPQWHPGWGLGMVWAVALSAAVLFFVSVLLHELAHALVGRLGGVTVNRITLFIFGGMAHMRSEARTPKAELSMALAGPLASLVIGIGATALGYALWSAPTDLEGTLEPARLAQTMGPVATLLLWLGPINILLALFNMVPGFPLDGGRVLRSIIWWITGDLHKATAWAAGLGRFFGWFLMGLGVAMALGLRVPIFGTGALSGIWLILIGWFLSSAAASSYQHFVTQEALEHVPVAEVMRSRLDTVTPETTLRSLVRDHFMNSDQRCFPVLEGDQMLGLVCMADIRQTDQEQWDSTRVTNIMTPTAQLITMTPNDEAADALHRLSQQEVDQIPVLEEGQLRGLVRRQDIMRWLTLRNDHLG